MWYLAELLFAELRRSDVVDYQCEASNVIFEAADAGDAFRKAVAWGLRYASEPPANSGFLGVAHLTTVGDEIGDGVEICGRFFTASNVWDQTGELIPSPNELKAIQWERGADTPIEDLLSAEQIAQLRRAWG